MTTRSFPAITLWQPWASLIFADLKDHETRAFPLPAHYVDAWVAVHAARRVPPLVAGLDVLCRKEFGPHYRDRLPRGRVLGLVRFGPAVQTDSAVARSAEDLMCGDWSAGRWAWPILKRRALDLTVFASGRQGWWRLDLEAPADLGEEQRPTHGSLI